METQQILSPFTVTYLKSGIHAVAKMVRFLFVPRKSFLQWYGSFKTRTLFYFKISALISLVVAFSHTNIYRKTTFDKRFLSFCFFPQVGDYNSLQGIFTADTSSMVYL